MNNGLTIFTCQKVFQYFKTQSTHQEPRCEAGISGYSDWVLEMLMLTHRNILNKYWTIGRATYVGTKNFTIIRRRAKGTGCAAEAEIAAEKSLSTGAPLDLEC